VSPTVFGPILGSALIAGFLLMLLGPIVFAIDRRALRQGHIDAFRRGYRMFTSRRRRAVEVVRVSGTLRTTEGEGQWLNDDVFGFWSAANYRTSSAYFGWVGTATMVGQDVLLEVRVLRGAALRQAGALLWFLAFAVVGAVAWQIFIVALPVATAFLWWAWRAVQRERSVAMRIAAELSRKFEGERWG
jgi:hypothetical protein